MEKTRKIEDKLTVLEERIDELVGLCRALGEENQELKKERDSLANKNSEVRTKVNSMIDEIRTLEGQV
jgi:uncharacterized protein (TIGR02449 family)